MLAALGSLPAEVEPGGLLARETARALESNALTLRDAAHLLCQELAVRNGARLVPFSTLLYG